jgi:hypothetical protein
MNKNIYVLLVLFSFLSGCSSVSDKVSNVEVKNYELKSVVIPKDVKKEDKKDVIEKSIETIELEKKDDLDKKEKEQAYVDKIANFFKVESITNERKEVIPYFWFAYSPPEYLGVLNGYEIKDDKIFINIKNGYNLISVSSQMDKNNVKFDSISKIVDKKLETMYAIELPKLSDRLIVKLSDLKNKKHYVLIEPVKQ